RAPAPAVKQAPAKRAASKLSAAPIQRVSKKKAAPPSLPQTAPSAAAGTNGDGSAVGAGASAPSFELSDEDGQRLSVQQLAGKPYVLYFYPKDDTPGCTAEACMFRDSLNRFAQQGVRIIGVSPDSPQSHTKFKQKYGLNFTLLSDPDKSLAQAYGVWTKKSNYGREYMGIERSTFLIGDSGKVKKAWRKVRVPGHVDAVLAELTGA
ncbi:MAG TPA: thioredoxin-dependent thiol peroxidase, partial [Polyangiaceae bacterium]|nr:thioredoxin-dependent thiol peroxidase [Polyangiaceae bacterium]